MLHCPKLDLGSILIVILVTLFLAIRMEPAQSRTENQSEPELTQEATQSLETGTSHNYSSDSTSTEHNPTDSADQSDPLLCDSPDIDQLIAEADRQFEALNIGTETNQPASDPGTGTNIQLEPTKYTRAITKIQKFDTKLRVLSMRDKALKRHSKSMKALLEAGKVEEAEFLALQVPGNDILDEECIEEDGIFHQTELDSKSIHLPPIKTREGPLNLVTIEPYTMDERPDTDTRILSDNDVTRLEEILEDTGNSEGILTEGVSSILQEIDSKLELMGAIQGPLSRDDELVSVPSSLEDILSREYIPDRFVSSESCEQLQRIDTELELMAKQDTSQDVIETILSAISDAK